MRHYDAIIIGSGQAGNPMAAFMAGRGKQTLLIESGLLGGTCVNTGCTPSKSFHELSRKIHYAQHLKDKGFSIRSSTLDFARLMGKVRSLSQASRESLENGLVKTKNLTIVRGTASFSGEKELEIALAEGGKERVSGTTIFINTGSRPRIPDIQNIGNVEHLTNLNVFELNTLPDELLIIGGGFIGIEFAQNFARLGSKVHLLNKKDQLLPSEDDDIAEEITTILKADGVHILNRFEAAAIAAANGKISVGEKEGQREVKGTHLLVATGRQPNSDALQLDKAGIETDEKGFIQVNTHLETKVKGVFAMGEVAGSPQFTHIAYDDFRVVRNYLLNEGRKTTTGRPSIYTLFTDPQLARFGHNEKSASKEGVDYECFSIPAGYVARLKEKCEDRGLIKVITEKKSGKILGASILTSEGGELMSLLQVAAAGNISKDKLKEMIFAHPLLSESLNNLF